jgi:quercetin dioxygenase-like cupin family protein
MRLKTSRASAAALALLVILSPIAATAEDYGQIIKLPEDITFDGPADNTQVTILYGDPSKAGFYVKRVKHPAGQEIYPHMHSDPHRTVLILSGTLYYAVGKEWDESKLKPLPAGSFFTEPTGIPHYAWAKDGEVILQISGIGPSATFRLPQAGTDF